MFFSHRNYHYFQHLFSSNTQGHANRAISSTKQCCVNSINCEVQLHTLKIGGNVLLFNVIYSVVSKYIAPETKQPQVFSLYNMASDGFNRIILFPWSLFQLLGRGDLLSLDRIKWHTQSYSSHFLSLLGKQAPPLQTETIYLRVNMLPSSVSESTWRRKEPRGKQQSQQ